MIGTPNYRIETPGVDGRNVIGTGKDLLPQQHDCPFLAHRAGRPIYR